MSATIVHAVLAADADLTALVADRIFTHVPARARKPYVVIGETVARPWDTASDHGRLEDVVIDVWSKSARRVEAEAVTARVQAALSFEALAALDPNIVNVVRGETRTRRIPERDLVQARIAIRITSENHA